MAKTQLNPSFTQIRGAIDGLVFRQSPSGPVVSRRPDMSRVKWSPAQKARRKLMHDAARHYRAMMKDPAQAARYTKLAAQQKIPVSALVMGEYMKQAAPAAKR